MRSRLAGDSVASVGRSWGELERALMSSKSHVGADAIPAISPANRKRMPARYPHNQPTGRLAYAKPNCSLALKTLRARIPILSLGKGCEDFGRYCFAPSGIARITTYPTVYRATRRAGSRPPVKFPPEAPLKFGRWWERLTHAESSRAGKPVIR